MPEHRQECRPAKAADSKNYQVGVAPKSIPAPAPDDIHPPSFLQGYTTGEGVGQARGQILGHRSGFRAGFEDGTNHAAEHFDAVERQRQEELNRGLVDLVISRTDAQRQRQILKTNGVTA